VLSLILLSLGHFFIDLYSSAIGAFQPLLVDHLHLSLRQAGLLGGVLIFSSSVMQPAYGYLSDLYHTRLFTVLAPAVAGIFISAMGLAPNFETLLLTAVLGGAGIASFHPQASAWATRGVTRNRSTWMAVFISAGTLGLALGPTYFSAILQRAGLHKAWWAALPGILITVLLAAFLKTPALETGAPRNPIHWPALRAVRKPLLILYFTVFIRSIVQISFTQFLPLYLHRERGFSYSAANYALSLYLASGALGGFLGGRLADQFGGKRVILLSMIGSVPLLALFFLAHGPLALAGLALGGLVLLFTIPVNVVMAQELAPGQAGTISSLMMGFSWGMAGLVFIPIVGWISDLTSMHAALFSLLAFPLLGFLLTLQLAEPHRV
jgi:FSR family fosmidomycin resistance protein-like MFS transporter